MKKQITVSQLTIYPVKSFAGIQLEKSKVDSMGLKFDRRWMVVSPEGKFLTQRTIPKMATINTSLDNEQLTLSVAGKASHLVPIVSPDSEKMDVKIWKDDIKVAKVGKQTDEWVSDVLGIDCHMVYIEESVVRQCDLTFSEKGERTGFADGFPILIISEESLRDLNTRLDSPIDMRRFRPNIVIAGIDAYAEDELGQFSINSVDMKGVKLCSRCPMPMVDPDLGERTSQEPIATLSTYRKRDNKIFFGMNVIQKSQGVIAIGDELKL